jgi:Glycosyl hydrolase family 26
VSPTSAAPFGNQPTGDVTVPYERRESLSRRGSGGGRAVVGRVAGGGLAILCLAVVACCSPVTGSGSTPVSQTPSPVSSRVGPPPSDLPVEGPTPPQSGAWVGAFVQPQDYTQEGRVAAVNQFESLVGRQLDVVNVYHKWDEPFPTDSDVVFSRQPHVLMISWAGTDTRVIASGSEDDLIRARARELAALRVPILLRWRWEMDRPNMQASIWGPKDFIAAWDHIRRIFDEVGVTNVGWVWCPLAGGFSSDERNPADFYPGDDEVDWLCADVYAQDNDLSFAQVAQPFLSWAAKHPKPIIIGEFGVRSGERGSWLRDAFGFVRKRPQIKAVVYFNGAGPNLDHRIQNSPAASDAFADAVKDPYFHRSTSRAPATESSRDAERRLR